MNRSPMFCTKAKLQTKLMSKNISNYMKSWNISYTYIGTYEWTYMAQVLLDIRNSLDVMFRNLLNNKKKYDCGQIPAH